MEQQGSSLALDANNYPLTAFESIALYQPQELDSFIRAHPQFENSLCKAFISQPISELIANVQTLPVIITNHTQAFLATVNEREYNNSFTCSPYSTYINYPKTLVAQYPQWWIKAILKVAPALLSPFFKMTQLDKVVQLNNHFASDNTVPEMLNHHLVDILSSITERFPHHTILVRRLNPQTEPRLITQLTQLGFIMLAERPIHLFNPLDHYLRRSHTKRDCALLRKSDYDLITHEDIRSNDMARIHQLYRMLFIDKHTSLNADYTQQFFQQCHQQRWLMFQALRHKKSGRLDAFYTLSRHQDVLYCGPIGYDITQPLKNGLYRMLMAASLQYAQQQECLLNFGGGSDQFKMNRGSRRVIEYTAVYCRHLSLRRQMPWYLIRMMINTFAQRLFKENAF